MHSSETKIGIMKTQANLSITQKLRNHSHLNSSREIGETIMEYIVVHCRSGNLKPKKTIKELVKIEIKIE